MGHCFVIINCKSSVCSQGPTTQHFLSIHTAPNTFSDTKRQDVGEKGKNRITHLYFLSIPVYTYQPRKPYLQGPVTYSVVCVPDHGAGDPRQLLV